MNMCTDVKFIALPVPEIMKFIYQLAGK